MRSGESTPRLLTHSATLDSYVGFVVVISPVASSFVGTGAVFSTSAATSYSDEKVANREIRVWHFVIENGY